MTSIANSRQLSVRGRHCLVALLAMSCCFGFATVAGAATHTPPPVPAYAALPLPDSQTVMATSDGELVWLGQRPIEPAPKDLAKGCWAWELVMDRWNPATGATRRVPLDPALGGHVVAQLPLPSGLLAINASGCHEGEPRSRIVLFPTGGAAPLRLDTDKDLGLSPELLALGDDAAALVSRDRNTRHIIVYSIRRQKNSLVLEAMPPLAIAYRGDYTAAAAGKDQLMILGGSDGNFRGCSPCRAETHVINLQTRIWRTGPSMLEARSELGATALPDGSILVTGGWTKAAGWGNGPSRTAERWDPASDKFEALPPMPTGNARHKHLWWTAPWGKTLLVAQGMTGAAHSFDYTTRTWRTAGEWIAGSEEGGCGFFPFVLGGNAYAWLVNRSEGHYSSKSCMEQKYASLSLLRPPSTAKLSSTRPPDSMLITYLHGAAFLPAAGSAPALVIGGSRHSGMNGFVTSSAVEAIDREGRVATLPSLRIARHGAQAFRIAGGVLVLGGSGPDRPYGGDRAPKSLPAEWLPPAGTTPWQWLEVSDASFTPGSAITQLKDGSPLIVAPGGKLLQLRLTLQNGKPRMEGGLWTSLIRERRNGSNQNEEIRVQEVEDGRIVVAGGSVLAERIALYSKDVLKPGQPDQYVGIGDYLPSRRHEIYDPSTKRWASSAPSVNAGGRVVVLADGRVIKAGKAPLDKGDTGPEKLVLEISNPAGSAWSRLAIKGSRLRVNDHYRQFSLEGELFASGELDELSTGGGPGGVEWFNPKTQQWELLWQAEKDDNWRKHQGRILLRQLTGADGKNKTVVIPVGGL